MKDRVVVKVADIKEEKIAEIKEFMGPAWDEEMRDIEIFEMRPPEKAKEGLSGLIDELLSLLSKKPENRKEEALEKWGGMSEAEKDDFRDWLRREHGHECSECSKVECPIHPDHDFVKLKAPRTIQ